MSTLKIAEDSDENQRQSLSRRELNSGLNQTGPNATAKIGTYNDVKGNQTITYTGSSQEQGKFNMLHEIGEVY